MTRPTDAELAILNVLWNRGPCTVRQVTGELNRSRPTGYTTVLKLMQIMTGKKLLKRDEQSRAHVYRALHPREQMQRRLVKDLVRRAFGGSTMELLQQAISGGTASANDLMTMRRWISEQEKKS